MHSLRYSTLIKFLCIVLIFIFSIVCPISEAQSQQYFFGWFDSVMMSLSPADIATAGGQLSLIYTEGYTNPAGYARVRQYLDNANKQGVKVILAVTSLVRDNDMNNLTLFVEEFKSHTAVLGWYVADEPVPRKISASQCITAYNLIKQYDNKPVYLAFCSFDIDANGPVNYRNSYDIMMFDFYPFGVGDHEFKNIETERKQFWSFLTWRKTDPAWHKNGWKVWADYAFCQARSTNKPVRVVLQAVGQANNWPYRLPTYKEERFMMYYSIDKGAKGIDFWSFYRLKQTPAAKGQPYPYDGNQWINDVAKQLASEFNKLAAAVKDGPVPDSVFDSSSDINSKIYRDSETGDYYLLALNTRNTGKKIIFRLNLPTQFDYAIPIYEKRNRFTIMNNQFSDSFDKYGVHNYLLVSVPPSK